MVVHPPNPTHVVPPLDLGSLVVDPTVAAPDNHGAAADAFVPRADRAATLQTPKADSGLPPTGSAAACASSLPPSGGSAAACATTGPAPVGEDVVIIETPPTKKSTASPLSSQWEIAGTFDEQGSRAEYAGKRARTPVPSPGRLNLKERLPPSPRAAAGRGSITPRSGSESVVSQRALEARYLTQVAAPNAAIDAAMFLQENQAKKDALHHQQVSHLAAKVGTAEAQAAQAQNQALASAAQAAAAATQRDAAVAAGMQANAAATQAEAQRSMLLQQSQATVEQCQNALSQASDAHMAEMQKNSELMSKIHVGNQ